MKSDTDNIKRIVQETLDELLKERLLPFKLTAYNVNQEGPGEYVVPFHDSRLYSVSFSCADGGPFKEVVRAAVLERVHR